MQILLFQLILFLFPLIYKHILLFLLKFLEKIPSVFGHLYTGLTVLVGWVLFSFEKLSSALLYLKTMFFAGGAGIIDNVTCYRLLSNLPLLLICILMSTPLPKMLCEKLRRRTAEGLQLAAESFALLSVSVLCMAFLIGGSYNPFLYFRF